MILLIIYIKTQLLNMFKLIILLLIISTIFALTFNYKQIRVEHLRLYGESFSPFVLKNVVFQNRFTYENVTIEKVPFLTGYEGYITDQFNLKKKNGFWNCEDIDIEEKQTFIMSVYVSDFDIYRSTINVYNNLLYYRSNDQRTNDYDFSSIRNDENGECIIKFGIKPLTGELLIPKYVKINENDYLSITNDLNEADEFKWNGENFYSVSKSKYVVPEDLDNQKLLKISDEPKGAFIINYVTKKSSEVNNYRISSNYDFVDIYNYVPKTKMFRSLEQTNLDAEIKKYNYVLFKSSNGYKLTISIFLILILLI